MVSIKDKLVAAGIRNLSAFGYDGVTADNIISSYVLSQFFKSMLEQNKGHGKAIDKTIDELIALIEAAHPQARDTGSTHA